jgi:hypothetical protein
MQAILSLIALGWGYRVLLDAYREKEGLKILGQVIGIFVMIAALLGLSAGLCPKMRGMGMGDCAMMKSAKAFCPVTGKMHLPPPQDAAD